MTIPIAQPNTVPVAIKYARPAPIFKPRPFSINFRDSLKGFFAELIITCRKINDPPRPSLQEKIARDLVSRNLCRILNYALFTRTVDVGSCLV